MNTLDKAIKLCDDDGKPFKCNVLYDFPDKRRGEFHIEGTNKEKIKALFEQKRKEKEKEGMVFQQSELNKFYRKLEKYNG